MSGEGFGLLSAIVLLGALGPAIAVAGAGLAAYGAAKGISAATRAGTQAYRNHQIEKERQAQQEQANLSSVNNEINKFYNDMNKELDKQARMRTESYSNLAKHFEKLESELNIDSNKITEETARSWQNQINAKTAEFYKEFSTKANEIEKETSKSYDEATKSLMENANEQIAIQQNMSLAIGRDAEKRRQLEQETMRVLADAAQALAHIKHTDKDMLVSGEYNALEESYKSALELSRSGQYEAAITNAYSVMRKSMALAVTLSKREEELFFALTQAYSALQMVREKLSVYEKVDIKSPENGENISFDMDVFTRNNYSLMVEDIDSKIAQVEIQLNLREAEKGVEYKRLTKADAVILKNNTELVISKEVDAMIEEGLDRMASFGARMKCMDNIVKDVLASTSYRQVDMVCEGDDPTAPVVLVLENSQTGDIVSIRLGDNNGDMMMNIDHFDETSELYREQFRSLVSQSLAKMGVNAGLSCKHGTENKASENHDYSSPDTIRGLDMPEATNMRSHELLNQ